MKKPVAAPAPSKRATHPVANVTLKRPAAEDAPVAAHIVADCIKTIVTKEAKADRTVKVFKSLALKRARKEAERLGLEPAAVEWLGRHVHAAAKNAYDDL